MSMIGNLARVTDEQLRGLYRSPDVIEGLLYPDMPSVKPSKQSLFARLFGRERSRKVGGLPTEDQMDLDKAWHVLHFLFTGSAWKVSFPKAFSYHAENRWETWMSVTAQLADIRQQRLRKSVHISNRSICPR